VYVSDHDQAGANAVAIRIAATTASDILAAS